MVKISIEYSNDLHCKLKHGPSGSMIETDAPIDNQGKGEMFSPTDLVAAALGSCIITTIGIVAKRDQIPIAMKATVIKEMVTEPTRRIGSLKVQIELPKELNETYRKKMERVAHTCPVHRSLHPDVQIPIEFVYV